MLWQLVTKLLHWMIEKDLTNQDAMRDTKFLPMFLSNYETDNIALDKLKCTCIPLDCTPNDVLEFIPEDNES